MRLSKKSDYALRALVSLSEKPGMLVPIRQLALENDVPRRFLEQIMLELKDQKLVEGIPGRVGGYRLAVPSSKLTVGKIIRLFDGMLAPINCVSKKEFEKCSQESKCRFRRLFLDIRNYAANLLESYTIDDIKELKLVKNKEIDNI